MWLRSFSQLFAPGRHQGIRTMGTQSSNPELFEYTSGRFLFNEQLRLAERHVQFNRDALATVICQSTGRPESDLISITKLAEGGFNRVLQATFKDGYTVLARIPYHSMVPKRFVVASEAATLGLLHSRGYQFQEFLVILQAIQTQLASNIYF
ncbi:hypothetical protein H112_03015 [Trichophyton rubrum D6]|nr:hypothetical protein H100_03019 [Trichophyton rubrum MR850]EZF43575.1 hypothetical protein H102_03013 [Trichophyton rubrum CBS 100081]EZF54227.1 hypothetical protein H103_03027 [Trichophyton rubrum CBS 288.86]EZF86067.1 hypothetical protein H110_03021 [Trichophyton rubrum MR1448]EZG18449.1 hypothetical protein H107_03114 [Trichophyton rubrum CBS 202.88]KDB35432.1 hypothetical protein H112_03015 [Trichophyton rubrum D6]